MEKIVWRLRLVLLGGNETIPTTPLIRDSSSSAWTGVGAWKDETPDMHSRKSHASSDGAFLMNTRVPDKACSERPIYHAVLTKWFSRDQQNEFILCTPII